MSSSGMILIQWTGRQVQHHNTIWRTRKKEIQEEWRIRPAGNGSEGPEQTARPRFDLSGRRFSAPSLGESRAAVSCGCQTSKNIPEAKLWGSKSSRAGRLEKCLGCLYSTRTIADGGDGYLGKERRDMTGEEARRTCSDVAMRKAF